MLSRCCCVGVVLLNCRPRARNWLAGCWHLLSFGHWQGRRKSLALHVRRRTIRVTGSAFGVRRSLCGMAARARVTLSWDVASRAGGVVMDTAASPP